VAGGNRGPEQDRCCCRGFSPCAANRLWRTGGFVPLSCWHPNPTNAEYYDC
jgi:hypothetical protein